MMAARPLLLVTITASAGACFEFRPHPYLTTAELAQYCAADQAAGAPIREVKETVCLTYLNAVVDAARVRTAEPGACLPAADAMWLDAIENGGFDSAYRNSVEAADKRLPLLQDVHGLFTLMLHDEASDSIPLHETPYEVVMASLALAWPCGADGKQPGYRVLKPE